MKHSGTRLGSILVPDFKSLETSSVYLAKKDSSVTDSTWRGVDHMETQKVPVESCPLNSPAKMSKYVCDAMWDIPFHWKTPMSLCQCHKKLEKGLAEPCCISGP